MRTGIRRPNESWAATLAVKMIVLLGAVVILFAAGATAPVGHAARAWDATGSMARIVIDPDPSVDGDAIRLGEIARVESDDPELKRRLEVLEVGKAALPGQVRQMHVGTLRLRMRQARLPERDIEIVAEGETIPIRTRYQILDVEDLSKLVEEWYVAQTELPPGAELRLRVDVPAEVAPVGALTIDVGLNAPKWGSTSVPLELRLDGRLYKRINASVEAWVQQPVWVAARPLARGETVTLDDVVLETRTFTRPVEGPPVDGLEFGEVPVRTTRFVREGTALTWDVVELIPDVQKGDMVMVVARKGSVIVQVPGEALSDGRVGQRVAVRNLGSGTVVYGDLMDDGTVLVQVW